MGVYADTFFAALQLRPRVSVSEWADRYRVIHPGTSPEPGPWSTDRTPYLRGIMDAICDPQIEIIVGMLASQVGKTEVVLNILGYFMDQDPSPILLVQPTLDAMDAFSKERIEPMCSASPALRGKLESGKDGRGSSRKTANTIRSKHFPGGYLAMEGANAPSGLASRAIRVLLCDEVDRYPVSVGRGSGADRNEEGDPITVAMQRTTNFRNRKIVLVSTPTTDGMSKIQEWHAKGDQRQFLVPCPHCGVFQVLTWERLIYKGDDGEPDLEHVYYRCAECDERIEERDKPAMLAAGEWVAQNPGGKIASFGDLSAIYSPWVAWRELAERWIEVNEAKGVGRQEFCNLKLGKPWVPYEQTIPVAYLERRRERYGDALPSGVLLLTAGVDVQDDRLELEVVGWGLGRESWGAQYVVLVGDPSQPLLWQQLDGVLLQAWQTDDGRRLGIVRACVDSAGHHTSEVYDFCRAREARGVYAIIGRGGESRPIFNSPSRAGRQKAALFTLGVDGLKSVLMGRLLLDEEGPGHCHFPREVERGYGSAYFKGLLSEKLVNVRKGGKIVKREWTKVVERNEPLDCRVYATAAMEIFSPNFELIEQQYRPGGQAATPAAAPRGRRQLSRGITV